jgi:Gly-Xaa carboxypeptidase
VKQLAKEFNLTFTAFGSAISAEDVPTAGRLTLIETWGTPLEPAPITPFGEDSASWKLSNGAIKMTCNAHWGLEGADNVFVSPASGMSTGNTGGWYFS